MPNLASVKFIPGDHYDKRQDPYFNPRTSTSNKCCMCGSSIRGMTKKNDGVCPKKDCARDHFFKEAHKMLDDGRMDRFERTGMWRQ